MVPNFTMIYVLHQGFVALLWLDNVSVSKECQAPLMLTNAQWIQADSKQTLPFQHFVLILCKD